MERSLIIALSCVCLASAAPIRAQEPNSAGTRGFAADASPAPAFDMGPLGPYLAEGDDGVWTLRNDGGTVVLENVDDPGSIGYYYAGAEPGAEGRRVVSVDVEVLGSTPESLAGLLYGFRESPKSYFMFTVGGDRSINLHEMRDGRFEQRTRTDMPELRAERTTLAIRETDDTIVLLVNGVETGSFGNELTGGGAVGIVAAGVGVHRFSEFEVGTTGLEPGRSSTFRPGVDPGAGSSAGFPDPAGTPGPEPMTSGASPVDPDASDPAAPASAMVGSDASPAPASGDFVYHDVQDPQRGMVSMSVPIPKDWTLGDGTDGVVASGPGGVSVFAQQLVATNYDATDPFTVQTLRQLGQPVVPLVSAERTLTESIAPQLRQRDYTRVDIYPYPSGSDFWRRMVAGTPMAEMEYEAVGSDWRLPDGTMANVVVTQAVRRSGAFAQWLVFVDEMRAPAARFEEAKAVLRHSAENTRFNPRWQQAHATELEESRRRNEARWAEANARGQAAHRARMAALDANARSAERTAKTYGDVLDISHEGYLKRSDMVAAGQAREIDAIGGVNVVSNPGTGERYRVEAGASRYWISDDGYWFGTDDTLYDPRTDQRANDKGWTQFRVER